MSDITESPAYIEALAQMMDATPPAGPQPGEQGSAEWLAARVGHVTASNFKHVMDFTGKGKPGAKRINYFWEVLIERVTGKSAEHFVTAAMQYGTDTEPLARMQYEKREGVMVEQTGFLHHPTIKWIGGSPDGLVGTDGGVEFKCPQPREHIRILLTNDITDYLPQTDGLTWLKARNWWDFVSYCPQMPAGLEYYRQRVPRDDDRIAELSADVLQFLSEVDAQYDALIALKGK